MATVMYDIRYQEARNRLTTAFRLILFIPHYVVAYFWSIFAEILAVVQWFIILFTGKRNQGIWDLQYSFVRYATRVYAYAGLMYDDYPPFGDDREQQWVRYSLDYEEPANRLTNGLRLIWAIPAIIIGAVLGIALLAVTIVSWFAIVITGKHGKGMFVFMLRVLRFLAQSQAYLLLMTDTYPKFESAA